MRRICIILCFGIVLIAISMPYAHAQRGFGGGTGNSYAPRNDRGGVPSFDRGYDRSGSREAPRTTGLVPLNQVIAGVSRQFSGRVLDADMQNGQQPLYRLKVLTGDGNVLAVVVDARSGRVLSVRGRR
jgi:hypothetical protein